MSIAVAALIPTVLLGGLLASDPNSFAVPSTASITLREPDGETLEVYALPLRPGDVNMHLYLVSASGSERRFASISMDATSSTGAHAPVRFYVAGPGHEIAEATLTRAIWNFRVNGNDGAGRSLSGSFTLPIN